MLFSLLYDFALVLVALAGLPKLLYLMLFRKKYRKSFLKRLGIEFPKILKREKKLIWVHAVSVGETKAVAKLARSLKKSSGNPILIISSITETGHAEAQRSIPEADHHVYLPFDFRWVVNSIVKKTAPDLVILCETDFWYNFLHSAKKAGASIAVVNAKISQKSLDRFTKFKYFSDKLFELVDLFCIQSEQYKKRFEQLGIPQDKLTITGNLKFDDDPGKLTEDEISKFKEGLRLTKDDKILVIGSSHSPEEHQLLEELKKVWKIKPQLKVMIVPRHPERFGEVGQLLENLQIPYIKYSDPSKGPQNFQVVLVDAMGVLRKCYQIANIAIVAGSYTPKVGGHNILEPFWYSVPVIYGPHMHSQPELVEMAKAYGAGVQVPLEGLEEAVKRLIEATPETQLVADAGLRLMNASKGSTDRTIQGLRNKFADF